MGAADWVFLAVLAASFVLGLWRGLVYECLSLAGWVVAFVMARAFAEPVAAWLPMGEAAQGARYAAGLVVVFVATAFACGLVTSLLRRAVAAVGLRPIDRSLGGVFGLLRGGLLLLVVVAVVQMADWHDAPWWRESILGPWLAGALADLHPLFPAAIADFLHR